MILECPNCATCYETPAVLPEEGRKVKCARCAHVWHAMPSEEPEPEPEVEPETETEPESINEPESVVEQESALETKVVEEEEPFDKIMAMAADMSSAEDEEADPDFTEPDDQAEAGATEKFDPFAGESEALEDSQEFGASEEYTETEPKFESDEDQFRAIEKEIEQEQPVTVEKEPEEKIGTVGVPEKSVSDIPVPPTMVSVKKPGSWKVVASWGAFAVFVFVTFISAFVFRVGIVKKLPTSAHIYAALGIEVNVRGLKFEAVDYKWDTEAGRPVLRVIGEIVNITDEPIIVPTVVFAFRDKTGAELYHWPKKIKTKQIPAKHQLPFAFKLPNPSKLVHSVELRFAKGGQDDG